VSTSTSKRLCAVVFVVVLLVIYRATRDTVRVKADLPKSDVKAILRGIEEWSSPKLFRHIEIEPGTDGTMVAWVREPGKRWSVTVFSNSVGGWKKVSWCLLNADHSVIKK
jgi:hypothetical protein